MLTRYWDRNSVCLFVTCVLCDKTKEETVDILTPFERLITLFFTRTEIGGRHRLLPEIYGQSDLSSLKNADFDQYLLMTSQP